MSKSGIINLKEVNSPYSEALKQAACRVIDSGQYIGGPEVEAFEHELAQSLHAPFAVGTGNGTDALRLILRAYICMHRLTPGQEVIVPANTYIATVLAITDADLMPVFVDADPQTMNMDISKVEQAITGRSGAIMPVHLYGRVCWSGTLASLAEKYRLLIVEDNAQAIGAQADSDGLFTSTYAGALGHAGAISFYPTKNLGALGDAGAVVTHDHELAKIVACLRNYGCDRPGHNLYAGINSRLDPMQAAMLRVKLPYLQKENAYRRRQAMAYDALIDNPLIIKPFMPAHPASHAWHQYVVRVPLHRHIFLDYLDDHGIYAAIHYPLPPYMQPCFAQYADLSFPISAQLADEVVSLPLHGADTNTISQIINAFKIN